VFGSRAVPRPDGGAYNAPPDPLDGFRGEDEGNRRIQRDGVRG